MNVEQVIKQLESIVKPERILTDPEDLYVYSFGKIFQRQNPVPNMVVRAISPKETQEVMELSRRAGLTIEERGETSSLLNRTEPVILLDNIATPELKESLEEKEEAIEILEEIRKRGYGTPRNSALALKALLLKKTFAENKECDSYKGYCTVASSFDGIETWSSKGRVVIVRGLQNGELEISKKIVDVLYTCTECGLCFARCSEDLKVHEAILATRRYIAEKGLIPKVFDETAKNIKETGDPGAAPVKHRLSWTKNLPIQTPPKKAKTLYWVGCMVADRTPETAKAFFNIMNHANVEFTMLMKREGCCGYILLSTGLWDEAEKNAEKVLSGIEETRAETLVTSCAGCYYAFKKLYPKILGMSLPCKVLHSTHFIEDLIKNGRLDLKKLDARVTYHDPCSLGRHGEVYDAPRNVLEALPGLTFAEMELNRQRSRCGGGGGGLWSFNHKISMESAYLRLNDLQPLNVDMLTTACPLCQMNFRYASSRKSLPVRVCDITEIVESALS